MRNHPSNLATTAINVWFHVRISLHCHDHWNLGGILETALNPIRIHQQPSGRKETNVGPIGVPFPFPGVDVGSEFLLETSDCHQKRQYYGGNKGTSIDFPADLYRARNQIGGQNDWYYQPHCPYVLARFCCRPVNHC
jgi:hypothetical protein